MPELPNQFIQFSSVYNDQVADNGGKTFARNHWEAPSNVLACNETTSKVVSNVFLHSVCMATYLTK